MNKDVAADKKCNYVTSVLAVLVVIAILMGVYLGGFLEEEEK